jgi:hypothetical protein
VEWVVAAVVFVGLFMTAPGLGVLLALCGVPILLAYGRRTGLAGCFLTIAMSVGILFASVVAWFLTCSALSNGWEGGDGGLGASLVVGGAVFIGLTALAVVMVKRQGHRRRDRRRPTSRESS